MRGAGVGVAGGGWCRCGACRCGRCLLRTTVLPAAVGVVLFFLLLHALVVVVVVVVSALQLLILIVVIVVVVVVVVAAASVVNYNVFHGDICCNRHWAGGGRKRRQPRQHRPTQRQRLLLDICIDTRQQRRCTMNDERKKKHDVGQVQHLAAILYSTETATPRWQIVRDTYVVGISFAYYTYTASMTCEIFCILCLKESQSLLPQKINMYIYVRRTMSPLVRSATSRMNDQDGHWVVSKVERAWR